jgi:hypothetical protein
MFIIDAIFYLAVGIFLLFCLFVLVYLAALLIRELLIGLLGVVLIAPIAIPLVWLWMHWVTLLHDLHAPKWLILVNLSAPFVMPVLGFHLYPLIKRWAAARRVDSWGLTLAGAGRPDSSDRAALLPADPASMTRKPSPAAASPSPPTVQPSVQERVARWMTVVAQASAAASKT